jgi:hypothetical protein
MWLNRLLADAADPVITVTEHCATNRVAMPLGALTPAPVVSSPPLAAIAITAGRKLSRLAILVVASASSRVRLLAVLRATIRSTRKRARYEIRAVATCTHWPLSCLLGALSLLDRLPLAVPTIYQGSFVIIPVCALPVAESLSRPTIPRQGLPATSPGAYRSGQCDRRRVQRCLAALRGAEPRPPATTRLFDDQSRALWAWLRLHMLIL